MAIGLLGRTSGRTGRTIRRADIPVGVSVAAVTIPIAPWGALVEALTEPQQRGWTVVSMKDDWKIVVPFEKS